MLHKHYMRAHVWLRVLIFGFTLAAAVCMGLNKQTSLVAGYQFEASYKSSPTFKFFVIGNAIAGGYTLLSMFFITNLVEGYLFHLFDLVLMGLVMASAASTTAIAYVGKKGNENIGWNMDLDVQDEREELADEQSVDDLLSFINGRDGDSKCVRPSKHKKKNRRRNEPKVTSKIDHQKTNQKVENTQSPVCNESGNSFSCSLSRSSEMDGSAKDAFSVEFEFEDDDIDDDLDTAIKEELDRACSRR